MTWQPEMELIDQLEGGELRLSVVLEVFGDREWARRVLEIYIAKGICALVTAPNSEEQGVPLWRASEILSEDESWQTGAAFYVSLTDRGAQAWSDGTWDQI